MHHSSVDKASERFKYKPEYQAAMSKKTKRSSKELPPIKDEVEYDVPDQDHVELFLAKNILS